MNIFKSKEIYKKTTKPGDDELRPVRGMYVSGEHRDPYCIDSNIQIMEVSSNHCDVVDYTSITAELNQDPIIRIKNIYNPNDFIVVDYRQSQTEFPTDNIIRIKGLISGDFNIIYYNTIETSFEYKKPDLRIINLKDSDDFVIINLSNNRVEQTTPEPMLHMLEHGSTDLEFN